MPALRHLVSLVILLSLCTLSPSAGAWRQAHTATGLPKLWHAPPPLPTLVAPGEERVALQAAIDRAVGHWTVPECTGLRFGPKSRRVTVTPVWTWPAQRRAAAWTDVVALDHGGAIIGAHIELDARLLFASHDPPDLDTVVMHELGHVLGLAHAGRHDVLMSRGVIGSGHGAWLSADDRAAICALYPEGVFDGALMAEQDEDGDPGLVWFGALAIALLGGGAGLVFRRARWGC